MDKEIEELAREIYEKRYENEYCLEWKHLPGITKKRYLAIVQTILKLGYRKPLDSQEIRERIKDILLPDKKEIEYEWGSGDEEVAIKYAYEQADQILPLLPREGNPKQ